MGIVLAKQITSKTKVDHSHGKGGYLQERKKEEEMIGHQNRLYLID